MPRPTYAWHAPAPALAPTPTPTPKPEPEPKPKPKPSNPNFDPNPDPIQVSRMLGNRENLEVLEDRAGTHSIHAHLLYTCIV